MTTTNSTQTAANRPIHKIRDKSLCISIWRNEFTDPQTGEIRVLYTLDFQRSYNRDDGWKNTTSVYADDGQRVANLYSRAHNWVLDMAYSNSAKSEPSEPAQYIQQEQEAEEDTAA